MSEQLHDLAEKNEYPRGHSNMKIPWDVLLQSYLYHESNCTGKMIFIPRHANPCVHSCGQRVSGSWCTVGPIPQACHSGSHPPGGSTPRCFWTGSTSCGTGQAMPQPYKEVYTLTLKQPGIFFPKYDFVVKALFTITVIFGIKLVQHNEYLVSTVDTDAPTCFQLIMG